MKAPMEDAGRFHVILYEGDMEASINFQIVEIAFNLIPLLSIYFLHGSKPNFRGGVFSSMEVYLLYFQFLL